MQAAVCFQPPALSIPTPAKTSGSRWKSVPVPTLQQTPCFRSVKSCSAPKDTSTVDYSSMANSVFPAEACETVGGEACDVEMYPEVKLKQDGDKNPPKSETVEREYYEYSSPKTVFVEEACDDLGGEFCDPDYQKGAK